MYKIFKCSDNALFDSFGRREFETEQYFDHHLAYRDSLHASNNRKGREEIG